MPKVAKDRTFKISGIPYEMKLFATRPTQALAEKAIDDHFRALKNEGKYPLFFHKIVKIPKGDYAAYMTKDYNSHEVDVK